MGVLVCFHAHPDDEVFLTGGVIRQASDSGHRVVLVTATDGALGEAPEGMLGPGESLAARRHTELDESAAALGVHRVVRLHYRDSGMAGTTDNSHPDAFCNVDVEAAAARLAAVFEEEHADVVTIYDPHGGYGHPDHVQVHRVGVRAAALAGVDRVYEAAINRDHLKRMITANPAWAEENDGPDMDHLGLPEDQITTVVDVSGQIEAKRAAMLAHATQVGDFGPFLQMPLDLLRSAFGAEWFRRRDMPDGYTESVLAL